MTYLELFLAAAEEPELTLYDTLIQKIRSDCDINDHEYILKFNYTDKTMMRSQVQYYTGSSGVRLRSFTHNLSYQLHYFEETNSLFFFDYTYNLKKRKKL
ncbi:hypothetical protein XaC1_137 [Xanthomonas phage XaC1]|nr:hypothetical protein XaC1_137 [Xanthomonas phage XaC1]